MVASPLCGDLQNSTRPAQAPEASCRITRTSGNTFSSGLGQHLLMTAPLCQHSWRSAEVTTWSSFLAETHFLSWKATCSRAGATQLLWGQGCGWTGFGEGLNECGLAQKQVRGQNTDLNPGFWLWLVSKKKGAVDWRWPVTCASQETTGQEQSLFRPVGAGMKRYWCFYFQNKDRMKKSSLGTLTIDLLLLPYWPGLGDCILVRLPVSCWEQFPCFGSPCFVIKDSKLETGDADNNR
jgi:hypothetical protein